MSGVFDFIYSCKSLFGKERIIKRTLKTEKISRESVIYVGDETRDFEALKKAGIPLIELCRGLNKRELFNSLHPDHIAGEPIELFSCVQQIFKKHLA